MALLDESNLLAERARHAKFRTNHVGTKLNEAELHELGELVAKRKETPAELIRGLILRELKRDKEGIKPSVEMIEITAIRLQIVNLLKPLLTGTKMTPETFDAIIQEVKVRKRGSALDILKTTSRDEARPTTSVAKYPLLQRPSRRFARYAARKIARP
jgi:hypothetical protein